MRRKTTMRRRLAITLGSALLAMMLVIPAASAKNTPNPFTTPDLPGCRGNVNATINHDSGGQNLNPSDKDSGGPGYFFRDGQEFKAALAGVRAEICG
jgi:hypothetical protein